MKRKIIEVYVEENDDEQTFIIEKVDDSETANEMMKTLGLIFYNLKHKEDNFKINYEEDE